MRCCHESRIYINSVSWDFPKAQTCTQEEKRPQTEFSVLTQIFGLFCHSQFTELHTSVNTNDTENFPKHFRTNGNIRYFFIIIICY